MGLQIGRLETVEDSGDSVPIPQNLQYTKRMLRSHNGIVDSTAQLSAQPSPAYTRRLSKIQDNRSVDNQHNLEDQNNGEEYTQVRRRLHDIVCLLVHQKLKSIVRLKSLC